MRYWPKKRKPIVGNPSVGISVATYRQTHCLHALLSSLQAQTYNNFHVYVVHDGPWDQGVKFDIGMRFDSRFSCHETGQRMNQFGHNNRVAGMALALSDEFDYIGTCNGDSYYAPTYIEWMLMELQARKAAFAYCNMVHSHKLWQPMKTEIKRGKIDVGCWLAESHLVASTPWESREFAADWVYINAMTKKLKPNQIAKVDGYLYHHN